MYNEILQAALRGNWDPYRKHYGKLSFDTKQKLHEDWFETFNTPAPKSHFDLRTINKYFNLLKEEPLAVVELGSASGALAVSILKRHENIKFWEGYDINYMWYRFYKHHPKLYRNTLVSPFEEKNLSRFNVFVSSHTIEHLNFEEVQRIAEAIQDIKYIILDTPLLENGQNWNGYKGAHVLTEGRSQVRQLFNKHEIMDEKVGKSWTVIFKRRQG